MKYLALRLYYSALLAYYRRREKYYFGKASTSYQMFNKLQPLGLFDLVKKS